MVAVAGFATINCDVIVHAERPKLLPFKARIRENIARLLGLPLGSVNVKAKTGEQVGPVGREVAIVAEAVVLIDELAS